MMRQESGTGAANALDRVSHPGAPGDKFPYDFLSYMALGAYGYLVLRSRASSPVMAEIEHDLAMDEAGLVDE